ncbi:MAG: DUF559 domain-containing protein [Sarcina sp.]
MRDIKIIKTLNYSYRDIIQMRENEFVSINSICDGLNIGRKGIVSIHGRNKEYLDKERILLNKEEIKELKQIGELNSKVSSRFCLHNKKYILYIVMLASNSAKALKIREDMRRDNIELFEELEIIKTGRFKKHENDVENYLKYSFGEVNVRKQETVGNYVLDFVLFDKINVEVDENGHSDYSKEEEYNRELYIKENTNYNIIRYNPNKDKPYILMNKILSNLQMLNIQL